MSAISKKVLDLAEQQGLLDGKAIAELRRQVAESKFVITPQAIAKVLVDHGHLTPFQARKLVSQAQANEPDPFEAPAQPRAKPSSIEDLTFADGSEPVPSFGSAPEDDDEVVELEAIDLSDEPAPTRPKAGKPPANRPPAEPTAEATTAWENQPKHKPPA